MESVPRLSPRGLRALPLCLALGLLFAGSVPARATDGVLEISQTCAFQTGCFSGDSPGLPVTITAPGSYRLTTTLGFSSVVSPLSTNMIEISADRVTLDLGGFGLRCSNPLTGNPCSSGSVHGIDVSGSMITIRNGFIYGMPGSGIQTFQVQQITIENIQATQNGSTGIRGGRDSIVRGCIASDNGGGGIVNGNSDPATGTLTIDNVARNNGGDGISGSGTLRGNIVSDNEGNGITGLGALIEGNVARANTGNGIATTGGTLVVRNVIKSNAAAGIGGLGPFTYRDNAISGGITIAPSGGTALNGGGNSCNGSLVCP